MERFTYKSKCGDYIASWNFNKQHYKITYKGKQFRTVYSWDIAKNYLGGTQEETRWYERRDKDLTMELTKDQINNILDMANYTFQHERQDFECQLLGGDLSPRPGVDKSEWRKHLTKFEGLGDESSFDWLAENTDGHVYCSASRAYYSLPQEVRL